MRYYVGALPQDCVQVLQCKDDSSGCTTVHYMRTVRPAVKCSSSSCQVDRALITESGCLSLYHRVFIYAPVFNFILCFDRRNLLATFHSLNLLSIKIESQSSYHSMFTYGLVYNFCNILRKTQLISNT